MNSRSLMIDIQFQGTREICPGLLELLKAEMTESHHIETVHFVSPVEIILEYQKIRQRNKEYSLMASRKDPSEVIDSTDIITM